MLRAQLATAGVPEETQGIHFLQPSTAAWTRAPSTTARQKKDHMMVRRTALAISRSSSRLRIAAR